MPDKIEIAPLTPDKVPVLLDLIMELAVYENLQDQVTATPEDLTRSFFGDGSSAGALLVFLNGEVAGYCIYFKNFSTFRGVPGIYVEDVYIQPDKRRFGLGKKVFIHLAKMVKAMGGARLEFAVLDWNRPALDFYHALGAKHLSDWLLYRFTDEDLDNLAALEEDLR